MVSGVKTLAVNSLGLVSDEFRPPQIRPDPAHPGFCPPFLHPVLFYNNCLFTAKYISAQLLQDRFYSLPLCGRNVVWSVYLTDIYFYIEEC